MVALAATPHLRGGKFLKAYSRFTKTRSFYSLTKKRSLCSLQKRQDATVTFEGAPVENKGE